MKKRLFLPAVLLLCLFLVLGACTPSDTGTSRPPTDGPTQEQPQGNGQSPGTAAEGLWNTDDIQLTHIRSQRLIAFTFDDGPKAETQALLDVFADFNAANPDWQAHATLFILGGNVNDANKAVLQNAFDAGMELGNHSFSHPDLTKQTDATIAEETDRTDALLREIDGKDKHLLRPPGGHYDERVLSLIGVPCINWTGTLDTSDWSGVSENDIYNKVMNNLMDGGIVLMHQGYTDTVNAVKRLLPDLKERGFQVVSVSELAKAYGIELYAGHAYDYLG